MRSLFRVDLLDRNPDTGWIKRYFSCRQDTRVDHVRVVSLPMVDNLRPVCPENQIVPHGRNPKIGHHLAGQFVLPGAGL